MGGAPTAIITGIAKDGGLEDDATTRVLRHAFATTLVRSGTGLVVVAGLLGHARVGPPSLQGAPGEGGAPGPLNGALWDR